MKSISAALVDRGFTRIAVANPDSAPAGRYARQALSGVSPNLWSTLYPKLVFADDVRGAARYLRLGSVDAAVLYETDTRIDPNLRILHRFASGTHDPIHYVGTITSPDPNPQAKAFLSYLTSPTARAVWHKHGFGDLARPHQWGGANPLGGVPPILALSAADWSAIALSVRVSSVATMTSLVPGVLLAIWLARTRSRLRFAVELITMAPLVVPPVVTGFLLLIVIQRMRLPVLFTWWAATLASAIVAFPLLVRTVRTAIEGIDPRFGRVAATLGASRWRVLRTITLPLAWRGIVAGALLAWARAIGEFGATIVVSGNMPGRTRTIPLAVWTHLQSPTAPSVVPLVTAALLLSVAAMGFGELMTRRNIRRRREGLARS